jgi:hypothetical protein
MQTAGASAIVLMRKALACSASKGAYCRPLAGNRPSSFRAMGAINTLVKHKKTRRWPFE